MSRQTFRAHTFCITGWPRGIIGDENAHYYFDVLDDDGLLIDDEGLEIWDIQAVQVEAARSLVDMARDALRKPALQSMERISIQVRDEAGAVMNVPFTFEIDRKKLRAVLFNGRAHDRSGPRIAYIAP